MRPSALKEKIIYYIYEIYKLGSPSNKRLIIVEKDVAEEAECPAPKVKTVIESLRTDGILSEVVVGYVPGKTVPAGHAVFITPSPSPDCPEPGYKIVVNQKKLEKIGSLISSKFISDATTDVVEFNSQDGVVRYGVYTHKFHRNGKDDDRLHFFRNLWEERKHLRKGKEIHKGESFPPEKYAIGLNFANSVKDFTQDKRAQRKLFGLLKGINRNLRDKKIPAHIERENGIQLTITE
ncbi:MAG: hypothetical protein A2570_01420 [Candidatus Brennerbacteria bacterium RIFOXYD1_FULL_41_16]|uniref:Uncharacterized protein n=1 Tax=Candidatus Brennerbacteria bacterium RIFOXYD1_FULL_41_16 TaxID=1797529 RepID=A0A1G1XL80_9BACT|nr:MAG: hypothetical protein A2570_01420 [Candidatus Brennerbacteria bacterium RIFOXYD1_FULL_41_16]